MSEGTPEELGRADLQPTEAEAALRMQKDPLERRPRGPQSAERVPAHRRVCFLAYVLRKTLQGWSKHTGLGHCTTTLWEAFARIPSTDVTLPTTDGRTVRLRCVVRPARAPSLLLSHLGLCLPERLRIPRGLTKCSANFSVPRLEK